MGPTLKLNSGTQFPAEVPLGKLIPVWSLILGHSFPNKLNGKVCPTLESNSGTRFPKRAQRETASHSERQFRDAASASKKKPRLAMEPGLKAQLMRLMVSTDDPSAMAVRALPYPR